MVSEVIALVAIASVAAAAQSVAFQLDPQRTSVKFTLGDVLHTVNGTFRLKQGSLLLDPRSNKLTGEIVVDAKSGQSGSGMRDRKMHREVLESERYREIAFHPDRIDGMVLDARKILSASTRNFQHPRSRTMNSPCLRKSRCLLITGARRCTSRFPMRSGG